MACNDDATRWFPPCGPSWLHMVERGGKVCRPSCPPWSRNVTCRSHTARVHFKNARATGRLRQCSQHTLLKGFARGSHIINTFAARLTERDLAIQPPLSLPLSRPPALPAGRLRPPISTALCARIGPAGARLATASLFAQPNGSGAAARLGCCCLARRGRPTAVAPLACSARASGQTRQPRPLKPLPAAAG